MSQLRQEILQALLQGARPSDTGLQRRFRFPETFIGFQGHFPGEPVLPAFIQVLTAQVAVEEHCGEPLLLEKLLRARFTRIIRPGEDALFDWDEEHDADEIRAKAVISVEGEKASSFIMSLKKAKRP